MMTIMVFTIQLAFSQDTIKHVVERGETLESIAEKYGTTKERIIALNPKYARFIYVGVELTIPVEKAEKVSVRNTESPAVSTVNLSDDSNESLSEENISRKGLWLPVYEMAYGFIEGKSHWNLRFTGGANYFCTDHLYVRGQIGYSTVCVNTYIRGENLEFLSLNGQNHYIMLPFQVGYLIGPANGSFALVPFAGLDINIGVKSKCKSKTRYEESVTKSDIGGKVGLGFRLGAELRFNGLALSGSYVVSMNDKQKAFYGPDGYIEASLSLFL